MIFETGKPFPLPYPQQEGCVLEIGKDGSLICLVQMPGLSRVERQAFKKSFSRYGYLESGTTPPIAIWTFMFPKPMNPIDVNFNARIANPEGVRLFMAPVDGQIRNLITFFLLDRNILQGIKAVGLEPDAIRLFHGTIRKQLDMPYSQPDFDRALKGMFSYSTDEMFMMSRQFRKGDKQ